MISLRHFESFGDVAAEEDAVLEYFLATDAVKKVAERKAFLVLGRKGTGKTAIVRHFTEGPNDTFSKALNLRNYPWSVHATRVDHGASEIEAYVSSWRYLIAVQLASLVLSHPKRDFSLHSKTLASFLRDNYGGVEPLLSDVLRPPRLSLANFKLSPSVMGNSIGGIDLDRKGKDHKFGLELNALTSAVLDAVYKCVAEIRTGPLALHFDELDQGLDQIDIKRSRMLIGLVLAARDIRREAQQHSVEVNPVVYLRTDLWDELEFSDKNKISQSLTLHLEWNRTSLQDLVSRRLSAKLSDGAKWDDVVDPKLMRGSQTKWNHIIARTFERPRDVISFLNITLAEAKKRKDEPVVIENRDVVGSRDAYSRYLKQELNDEIAPHWPSWEEALQACSAISSLTFERGEFEAEYNSRRSKDNSVSAGESIALLYKFSVIGYRRRIGYGGSGWVFQYSDPEAGWDSAADSFKVHLGLKEFAKLKEKRETY